LKDTLRSAWREIRRRPGKSALGVMYYALAIVIILVLTALLGQARKHEGATLRTSDTGFLLYTPYCGDCEVKDKPRSVGEGLAVDGRTTKLFDTSALTMASQVGSAKDVSPYLLFLHKDAKSSRLVSVGGFDPNGTGAVAVNCCSPSKIVAGRFLSPADKHSVMLERYYAHSILTKAQRAKMRGAATAAKQDEALSDILSEQEAEDAESPSAVVGMKPGKSEPPFPKTIEIAGETFAVTGVVDSKDMPGRADIFMHLDDASRIAELHIRRLGFNLPVGEWGLPAFPVFVEDVCRLD